MLNMTPLPARTYVRAIIRQALSPRNLDQEHAVMIVRAGAILVGTILVLILIGLILILVAGFSFMSAKAVLIAALFALTGVLITQVVNTYIARSGQKNQQKLED